MKKIGKARQDPLLSKEENQSSHSEYFLFSICFLIEQFVGFWKPSWDMNDLAHAFRLEGGPNFLPIFRRWKCTKTGITF